MTQNSEVSARLQHVARTRVTLPTGPAPLKALAIRVKADAAELRNTLSRVKHEQYGEVLSCLVSIQLRLIRIGYECGRLPEPLADWPEQREYLEGEAATQIQSLYEAASSLCMHMSEGRYSPEPLARAFRAINTAVCALGLELSDVARVADSTISL